METRSPEVPTDNLKHSSYCHGNMVPNGARKEHFFCHQFFELEGQACAQPSKTIVYR